MDPEAVGSLRVCALPASFRGDIVGIKVSRPAKARRRVEIASPPLKESNGRITKRLDRTAMICIHSLSSFRFEPPPTKNSV